MVNFIFIYLFRFHIHLHYGCIYIVEFTKIKKLPLDDKMIFLFIHSSILNIMQQFPFCHHFKIKDNTSNDLLFKFFSLCAHVYMRYMCGWDEVCMSVHVNVQVYLPIHMCFWWSGVGIICFLLFFSTYCMRQSLSLNPELSI